MARTVAGTRQKPLMALPPWRGDRKAAFSFCIDRTLLGVRHDLCPGEVHSAPGKKEDIVRRCACCEGGHQ